jgi:hypothetical protein
MNFETDIIDEKQLSYEILASIPSSARPASIASLANSFSIPISKVIHILSVLKQKGFGIECDNSNRVVWANRWAWKDINAVCKKHLKDMEF